MKSAEAAVPVERVAAVRAFNRFYTHLIGVVSEGLLETPYSLTEARVIFELAQRDVAEVAVLRRSLDLDAGYLSRILSRFEADGLVRRDRSPDDGRRQVAGLTDRGRTVYRDLDGRSGDQIGRILSGLPEDDQRRLVGAMGAIEGILGERPRPEMYVLRAFGPGDFGWVVQRHGALYAAEYGWDATFEALVAKIAARFIERLDARCERCWIAERDGARVGSVFLVRRSATVAQLRLLLVEPSARGHGIGARLVDQCLDFARTAGYRRMMLWTNGGLGAARAIYEARGFRLTKEEPHHSFGHALVGQTFERAL
jgi:DNA-binding MarR family transcriptional regulator/N-acetylglutamate synthase-like GNAT family acetyltransferase